MCRLSPRPLSPVARPSPETRSPRLGTYPETDWAMRWRADPRPSGGASGGRVSPNHRQPHLAAASAAGVGHPYRHDATSEDYLSPFIGSTCLGVGQPLENSEPHCGRGSSSGGGPWCPYELEVGAGPDRGPAPLWPPVGLWFGSQCTAWPVSFGTSPLHTMKPWLLFSTPLSGSSNCRIPFPSKTPHVLLLTCSAALELKLSNLSGCEFAF